MDSRYIPAPLADPNRSSIEAATNWLVTLMTGSVAVGLAVLAVATIGLLMLVGRLPVRDGLRVVLGCFVLLGAPTIAMAFIIAGQASEAHVRIDQAPRTVDNSRKTLPPSAFDPYAGASLRQD